MAEVRFLNVDLDIESRSPLAPILEELGEQVLVLHEGACREHFTASIEIADGWPADADSTIGAFCMLLENLPNEARRLWDGCCTRVFDIGYVSGDSPCSFRSLLHPETVRRVAALGAAVMITIYPTRNKPSEPGAAPDPAGPR